MMTTSATMYLYTIGLVVIVLLCHQCITVASTISQAVKCSAYNPPPSSDYWDTISQCGACVADSGCVFCESSLSCIAGNASGPSVAALGDDGDGDGYTAAMMCISWVKQADSCPKVPDCGQFYDCGSCASREGCAWCGSENACTTTSDALARECRGSVYDLPCPDSFATDNIIVGNVVVKPDATFGGGGFLNVTGFHRNEIGTKDPFELQLNKDIFSVKSAGNVEIMGGNKPQDNTISGNVSISAGDGLSNEGGAGGHLLIVAGDGAGVASYGGNTGVGGDVKFTGGLSKEGRGGSIKFAAGTSTSGAGGSIEILSGEVCS